MDIDGILRCPRCFKEYGECGDCGQPCEHCGHSEPAAPHPPGYLEPESIIANRYLIGALLGAGGFGVTYAAWDMTLNQAVAVKEYFPRGVASRDASVSDDIEAQPGERNAAHFEIGRNRFIREARMLALLEDCPGVVSVKDCLEANNTAYLVMEYVGGVSLEGHAKARGGKIPPDELLRLMREPIEALARVHATGLLHRDISPANLMLLPDGRVKLIDFGAAAALADEGAAQDATVILNRRYAAPEQYARDGELGTWTDVYGVCATMCALLTGEPSGSGEPLGAVARLGGRQRRALGRGLASNWKNRIRSMPELLSALYGIPLPEEIARRKRLVRLAVGAVCCSVAACLLLLVNAFWGIPAGDGFFVGLRGDGLALVRYTGRQDAPPIPASVLGLPLRRIERSAFMNNRAIEALDVPEGVRSLGDWAFYGCENLGAATLPDSLQHIGEAAFGKSDESLVLYGKTGSLADRYASVNGIRFADRDEFTFAASESGAVLTGYHGQRLDIAVPLGSGGHRVGVIGAGVGWPYEMRRVALPDSVQRIEPHAFEDCLYLASVALPSALVSIGDAAFLNCTELAALVLPDGVEVIGEGAFSVCRSLGSVSLPKGLKRLGAYAFERCEALSEIRLPDGLDVIEEGTFMGCSALRRVTLPGALRAIEDGAFAQCAALSELIIPEGTTSIGADAFLGCAQLSRAVIPASVTHIGDSAFYACASDLLIFGVAGSAAERYCADNGIAFEDMSRWAEAAAFEYAVDGDGGTARILRYNGSEPDVVIPSLIENRWVTRLAEDGLSTGAFEGNQTLRSVELPRYVTDIPNSCFDHCESLERVALPDGLRSIGIAAFNACAKLRELQLPDSLSAIGWSAFSYCDALKRLELPGRMLVLDGGFLSDSSVEVLRFGPGTPRIGCVLDGADALRELWIPASVTHIEPDALDGCPAGVVVVGASGSYAEDFARAAGVGFRAMDD